MSVYDRMLLDYFLSYHQFIHLLCRVAINCEKFTDTLVKLSVLIAYEGLPLHLALFPKLWTELCQSQSVLAKTCVKLLCDDPAFSEYIKCILMDERTFLNNNVVYSFLTCFLPKLQVLSGPSCSNLISVLVTNLLTEQSNLQPELALHRVELNKTSSLLNADLRSLVLLLSIQPPPSIDAALCPALQELLGRCRLCLQQRSSLDLEAKDLKSKAEDEGATPVKRRRVSSDDDREALTPASTSDTETRDSSSLIDPGTEQDPPSPEPTPATSRNMDSALKEEKMEVSSSSSSSFSSSSSSSLLQDAGDGFVQVEEPEAPQPGGTGEEREEERRRTEPQPPTAADGEAKDSAAAAAAAAANVSGSAPTLPEDATSPSAIGLAGDGSEGAGTSQVILSGGAPPPDMLDMLHRTVEATITIVTKLSVKATPSS
uniref:Ubiquitin specific peptidase 34 n=1 Tax=Xiphophorus maculatus TaxID=8083 RepID=A0A3B5R8Q4_XIPMA